MILLRIFIYLKNCRSDSCGAIGINVEAKNLLTLTLVQKRFHMTNPVNIYSISRIRDENSFNIVELHRTRKAGHPRTPYHEIESLRILVDNLLPHGLTVSDFDGFFHGFDIPQIGKEFDLLKFTSRSLLNIELKSQQVPEEQIHSQLLKNRHYLSHLGKRLNLFTVITNTMTCYRLTLGGELIKNDVSDIAEAIKRHSIDFISSIDEMFRASEYLVSPYNTPAKFIQGEYFLTQAQDQIKKNVLKEVETACGCAFFHITGTPGTGKTLLIYDISRELSKSGNTLLIYYGERHESLKLISDAIENLTIIPVSELSSLITGNSLIADNSLVSDSTIAGINEISCKLFNAEKIDICENLVMPVMNTKRR